MSTLRSGIPGISRTALWNAWKQIRQELRHSTIRDVVDYLDFDLDPDVWINRLIHQLANGVYEPRTPIRFSVAKGNGFSRRMTLPGVPDLVLYRAIVHHCYKKAQRREQAHVYFERAKLGKAAAAAANEARKVVTSPYTGYRRRRFYAWLKYDQYRKHLIFEEVFQYIVVSDVTNFFDSIQYQRVSDALATIAPAGMIGLLFFILERLSIRDAYTPSPAVGLPVDEFDCSRTIAHMVLYPHDERIVAKVTDIAYVRWMDDQNIGVSSRSDALRLLSLLGTSLSRLHLTANASKSKILTLSEARRHFHLDLNARLDQFESAPTATYKDRKTLRIQLKEFCADAKDHEGIGEWSKILKRTYRIASLCESRSLRHRAVKDIIDDPQLAERIADYMRATGSSAEFIAFAQRVWKHPEQIYADVNLIIFETFLLIEASGDEAAWIRRLAVDLLRGTVKWSGCDQCAEVAPLVILKFGDKRSIPTLKRCIEKGADTLPHQVVRAAAVVFASYGRSYFAAIRRTAGRMLRGELSETTRMLERIIDYREVPVRFNARLDPIWDALTRSHYLDIRRLLCARLLLLNERSSVRKWVAIKVAALSTKETISQFDRRLMIRLLS